MEPLIYYPTFEPPSEIWLKFSILYFENFKPIVPHERQNLLSDNFKRIQSETDLISLYSPQYEDGVNASLKAIEEIESILSFPQKGNMLFRQANLLEKWQNSNTWDFEIYREKFSYDWVKFCLEKNLGKESKNGILLSEELAFLFMTYLASEIAYKESAAIITDNNKFDSFTNYERFTTNKLDKRTKFAKSICSLLVPQNLNDIPIKKLIKFRRKNRELIRAFNLELDTIQGAPVKAA